MPPISWSERMEARVAALEARIAALEALLGVPPAGFDNQLDQARAQLVGGNDNAADDD